MGKIIDITGNVYGWLEVTGLNRTENKITYWDCKCRRCGGSTVLPKASFVYPYKKCRQISCGCYQKHRASLNCKMLKSTSKNGHLDKKRAYTFELGENGAEAKMVFDNGLCEWYEGYLGRVIHAEDGTTSLKTKRYILDPNTDWVADLEAEMYIFYNQE